MAQTSAARSFDALGNPLRRQILTLLSERPRAVGELAAALPVSRPAVSRHLRVLESAALVRVEPQGTSRVYITDTDGLAAARTWLDRFWDEALPRFALLAENLPEGGA